MLTSLLRALRPARVSSRRSPAPRLRIEALEERYALSWGGVPPATVVPTNVVAVTLNSQNDATGTASITNNEVDFYSFTPRVSGSYRLAATTPNSSLDTVLGVFNNSGQRLAFNDDISSSNLDSQLTINLTAGSRYFFGITNYNGTRGGSYTWTVDGPAGTPPPTPGGFNITLRISGLSASQQQIFDRAARRWEQVITGDIPSATYQGITVDDVLIDARGQAIDGPGGILGQAGPDSLRSGSRLPIHGTMQFDTADLANLERNGQLYDVILHEMGHVLGIGTIWSTLGLISGAGGANPRFLGRNATAQYNAIFGRNEASVPVEGNNSPVGSRDSHWRESVFGNELMTPRIGGVPNPLSRVTVGALADMGYTVNINAADNYTPPR